MVAPCSGLASAARFSWNEKELRLRGRRELDRCKLGERKEIYVLWHMCSCVLLISNIIKWHNYLLLKIPLELGSPALPGQWVWVLAMEFTLITYQHYSFATVLLSSSPAHSKLCHIRTFHLTSHFLGHCISFLLLLKKFKTIQFYSLTILEFRSLKCSNCTKFKICTGLCSLWRLQ